MDHARHTMFSSIVSCSAIWVAPPVATFLRATITPFLHPQSCLVPVLGG